jgi:hypothetical protein
MGPKTARVLETRATDLEIVLRFILSTDFADCADYVESRHIASGHLRRFAHFEF